MKRLLCFLLVCITLISVGGCSKFDEDYVYDGHSLIGKWMEKDYDFEYYISYEFFENGEVEVKEYYYGIEVSSMRGAFFVEKNVLKTQFIEYNGNVQHIENRFSMKDDMLVMLYLSEENQMEEKEMVLIPFDVESIEPNEELCGTWRDTSDPSEVWTFNKDLTGTVANADYTYTIKYSLKGKKLYIAYESVPGVIDSLVEVKYKVKNDKLTIKGEGVKLVFEKE